MPESSHSIRPEQMIADGQVVPSRWTLLTDADAPAEAGTAVPLSRWLALSEAGADVSGVGVVLEGDDDIAALESHAKALPVVALHFPKFSDGRSYSHAYRLRRIWSYDGPIVAFGDVLRDQLVYMSRCGIDVFYMRDDQDLEASLASFRLFSGFYQYNHL